MLSLKQTTSIFPIELFDEIFAHYADEYIRASSTWALVCKAFVHPSRSRLFSYVSLIPPRFGHFLRLLGSSLCTIAPYVKRLHIMDDDSHWILDALPRLACLTGVQSLELEAWDWAVLGKSGRDTFLEIFGHIHHLRLEDAVFLTFTHLTGVLYGLPDLASLSLIHIIWSSSPLPPAVPPPLAPLAPLRELRLYGPWPKQSIFDWLLSHDTGPFSVRRVEVIDVTVGHTMSLGRYLRRLGPALTEFSFRLLPISYMTELSDHGILTFIRDIDFAHNENLAHLDMRLLRPKAFSLFLHILGQAGSGNLRKVSVHMRPFHTPDIDLSDWPALDALLDTPPFTQMKELCVELEPRVQATFADMRALVLGRLTRCCARGIVNVVRVSRATLLVPAES